MADCLKSYPRKLSSVSGEAGVREHGLFREAAVRNNLLPLQCMLCWPALTTEHWKPKPSTLWLPFESRQNSSSPVKDHIQEIVSRLGIWKHQVSFCTKWFPTFSSQGEAEGLFLYKVLTATFVAFFKRIKSKSQTLTWKVGHVRICLTILPYVWPPGHQLYCLKSFNVIPVVSPQNQCWWLRKYWLYWSDIKPVEKQPNHEEGFTWLVVSGDTEWGGMALCPCACFFTSSRPEIEECWNSAESLFPFLIAPYSQPIRWYCPYLW